MVEMIRSSASYLANGSIGLVIVGTLVRREQSRSVVPPFNLQVYKSVGWKIIASGAAVYGGLYAIERLRWNASAKEQHLKDQIRSHLSIGMRQMSGIHTSQCEAQVTRFVGRLSTPSIPSFVQRIESSPPWIEGGGRRRASGDEDPLRRTETADLVRRRSGQAVGQFEVRSFFRVLSFIRLPVSEARRRSFLPRWTRSARNSSLLIRNPWIYLNRHFFLFSSNKYPLLKRKGHTRLDTNPTAKEE